MKPDIDNEMWKIVAGKIAFKDGKQYQLIQEVNEKIQRMLNNTDNPRTRIKLIGIERTMMSLTENVDKMGEMIRNRRTAAENKAVLENIRFVTSVIEDVVQDYAIYEVQRTEKQYQVLRENFILWEILSILLMVITVTFSVMAAWGLSRTIYTPIT